MKWFPLLLVAAVVVLHQDTWYWRSKALVLGFLPVGLFYHIVYTLLCATTMWTLILYFWPEHLDEEARPESAEASA